METTKIDIQDREWASELQIDLQEYIMRLYDSVDAEEGTREYEWGIETASGLPFCGCDVCQGREILSFLSGQIIEGYRAGKIGLYEDDPSSSSSNSSMSSSSSSTVLGCRSASPEDPSLFEG